MVLMQELSLHLFDILRAVEHCKHPSCNLPPFVAQRINLALRTHVAIHCENHLDLLVGDVGFHCANMMSSRAGDK
ncbi:hypothetical protein FHW37_107266 [Neorhizobium alkalisoli]|uniref:Uncharacterized protein n=1 Tax=Neorhizobium alkalisoli TaxID=528178 RepID=A0A561QHN6_9HYPH|nr:hypothetical protein FHW37_107266 [Neorhizobium alkalisoli]